MNKHPFIAFVDLIAYDQQLIDLEKESQDGYQYIRVLEQQLQDALQDQQNMHTMVSDAKKQVVRTERLLQEHQQMIDQIKQKSDLISSSKEYASYQARLKLLEQEYAQLEHEVLQAWHASESAVNQEALGQQQLEKKLHDLRLLIDQTQQKVNNLTTLIEQKKRERVELLTPIAPEWLASYEQLKGKIQNPMVPVESDACSYCCYQLPQPQLSALRRRALLQCKGCFRFLYLPSAYAEILQS